MSRPQPDQGAVIALSPYRAQLGRGRRLRRAEALLEGADPEGTVRALPGDELYYIIHEIGLQDAADILALATPEQLQVALDFAVWERDQLDPARLGEWLEAIAAAPIEKIGSWMAGLDSELFGLIVRKSAHIYDLTQEAPPDEPVGTFFPTPDGFFLLDVTGLEGGRSASAESGEDEEASDAARVAIRLVDACYRADRDFARRMLIGARSELDSELEEAAHRWRQGRMADLGFADYYEALEVYRELDPATLRPEGAREGHGPVRPVSEIGRRGANAASDALRVPGPLAVRLSDLEGSPFARAAQKLRSIEDVDELRFALVALTNRVLAADRIAPGDDRAVTDSLGRMVALLDIGVEWLAQGSSPENDERGAEALRAIPLVRIFRLGVTLVGKVRRLGLALRHDGPFGEGALRLAEPDDATVLENVTRVRPMFPRLLETPASAGERPFRSLADIARATAALEQAAAAQAMVRGLGVRPEDLADGAAALVDSEADVAALDTGLLARTVLVRRLLEADRPPGPRSSRTGSKRTSAGAFRAAGEPPMSFRALEPDDVTKFEALVKAPRDAAPKLSDRLREKAKAILKKAAPESLAAAAASVADRWIASLAPLEPVLVRKRPSGRRRR